MATTVSGPTTEHADPTPLLRLLPLPAGPTSIVDAYDVRRPRPAGRPWVDVCMVASLDGSVTIDGTSGGLGNPNDVAVLATMRRIADVLVVGAGTVSGEGYGPPRKEGQRLGVATNSGRVDLESDLFTSGAGFVMAPRSAAIDESRVEVLRSGDDELDLAEAIARLDEIVPGVAHVQAEGGPRLNGSLAAADLIDELVLNLSPNVVGGPGPRPVDGAPESALRFEVAHLLTDDDGFVFGRWLRRRD